MLYVDKNFTGLLQPSLEFCVDYDCFEFRGLYLYIAIWLNQQPF